MATRIGVLLATKSVTRDLASGEVISRVRVTGVGINPVIPSRAFLTRKFLLPS